MRRNGKLRTPIVIPAMLVATALLADVIGFPIHAQGQPKASDTAGSVIETAFAMPRNVAPAGLSSWQGSEVGTIRPLSAADASHVREIFALQRTGRFDQAARLTRDLHDDSLLGDILADRYLAAGANPSAQQLRQWLQRWSDLPDAGEIRHRLFDMSRGRTTLPTPVSASIPDAGQAASPEEADPATMPFSRNALLDRTVAARLEQGDGGARSALRLVAATRHIDPLYAATLRAEIARDLLTRGDDELALRTAQAAMQQSGSRIGLAAYVAGLAAWRLNQTGLAQSCFEQASRAALTAAGTRAGAAFWAARAHRQLHDDAGWKAWLHRAAAASHTFYGMLATRLLDQIPNAAVPVADMTAPGSVTTAAGPGPGGGVLGEVDVEAVAATTEGRRAFSLLQVGEPKRAEAALRQLWPKIQGDAALCRSIALVAQEAGMTATSSQLFRMLRLRDDQTLDATQFPIPHLAPRSGFIVNPALVYALTRLESNFNSRAVSGAGAHGLMQIMPVTASFVLRQNTSHSRRLDGDARALRNPAFNLEVGQRYLTYLASQDDIHGDLIRLLASYNAGPNAVAHWRDGRPELSGEDPLMYIGTLPVRETRDFVHRGLSYLWIYADRMDLPTPSLDALAQGNWPRFDDEQKMASARPEIMNGTH